MEGTIAAVAVLPNPWPSRKAIELFVKEQAGERVAFSADARGCFRAVFSRNGQTAATYIFGPMDAAGASKVVLILAWSPKEVLLKINGLNIPPEVPGAQPVHLPAQAGNSVPIGPVMPHLDPTAGASNDERFFLETLADIDQKVIDGDRYSLIRASGLLRQLLLDDLLHAVNRNYRVRISFSILDLTRRLPREPEAHWMTLDPSPFPGAREVTCSLDQFLATPCLCWNGTDVNVRDLIRACANAKGGVHLGKAKTIEEQVLLDWDIACAVMGEEPSLQAMAGICRVVLVGLRRLAAAVMEDHSPTKACS